MNIHLAKSPSNGLHYVYLTESYRDKNGKSKRRFIEKLGILEELQKTEPNILERLKLEAKMMTEKEKKAKTYQLSIKLDQKLDRNHQLYNYGYSLIKHVYKQLNIDTFINNYQSQKKSRYNLDQILELLVYSRMIDPKSKMSTHRGKKQFFTDFEDVKLEEIYKSLDDLTLLKDDLMIHLNEELTNQGLRDASLVFYDVTNYYFESTHFDGFREKGVSKENMKTGIVQMGLFIDNKGLPITYELFPGNTNDLKTMRPMIEKIKKDFNLGKITIVADKGNNSGINLATIDDYNDQYIISQRIRNAGHTFTKIVLDQEGYQYSEDKTFKYKLVSYDKEVKRPNDEIKVIKEHLMCFWSEKEERYQRAKRGLLDEKIDKFLKEPALLNASNSFGIKKYFKQIKIDRKTGEVLDGKNTYVFNKEKYERDLALDGYYTIVTNDLDLHPFDMIKHYRGLAKIEESFRVTKSDLEGRPIYVWTTSHIKGHFLTCYLSLLLYRLLQLKLDNKYPVHQIKEAIKAANCIEITQGIYKIVPSTPLFYELSKQMNKDFSYEFMKSEDIKKQIR